MKKINLSIISMLLFSVVVFFSSCQNDELDSNVDENEIGIADEPQVLAEFSVADLQNLFNNLNLEIAELISSNNETLRVTNPVTLLIEAIKVSGTTSHPTIAGKKISNSGMLFLPKFSSKENLRILVVNRGAAIDKKITPTVVWNDFSDLCSFNESVFGSYDLLFLALVEQGFAILIPDYIGYGDSFGQCYPATLVAKPTATSVANLIKDAQKIIKGRNMTYKNDIVITGYSLGGYVSIQLARELETNSSYGIPVKHLFAGGANTDLKYIVDKAREDVTDVHMIVPAMLASMKQNGYPQINMQQIFKSDWASVVVDKLNGNYSDIVVQEYFTPKGSKNDIYTANFINNLDEDSNLAYINTILNENSLKPWVNKCEFYMMHGTSDKVTYEAPAKAFVNSMKALGGNVKYKPCFLSSHATAGIEFYIEAIIQAQRNR